MFQTQQAFDAEGRAVSLHSGLPLESASKIQHLIRTFKPMACAEVGCAMGASTLAILYALQQNGAGAHVAIDPHQLGCATDEWNGVGLSMVGRAGLSHRLEFMSEPSHSALPRLLAQGRRFDLIVIDGWHAFDATFVDYFFSDLLLHEGGVLIFDDWSLPQVHQVCWFLETHKAYQRLGPAEVTHPMNLWARLGYKLRHRGGALGWDPEWGTIVAYRKLRHTTVPWAFFHSEFYPHFRLYRWWLQLKGRAFIAPV